jgi:CheY-like chemotaxis protein
VLLVEDEGIVLIDLELTLGDLGFVVAGSASDLETGLALARELALDVAVLDINLSGRESGPIADVLAERGVPFIFASGYTQATLPARHPTRPLLPKPFSSTALREALNKAMSGSERSSEMTPKTPN